MSDQVPGDVDGCGRHVDGHGSTGPAALGINPAHRHRPNARPHTFFERGVAGQIRRRGDGAFRHVVDEPVEIRHRSTVAVTISESGEDGGSNPGVDAATSPR